VGELHDRMPVIRERERFEAWLTGAAGRNIRKPAANDMPQCWPVSRRVNRSRAPDDDASLIEAVATCSRCSCDGSASGDCGGGAGPVCWLISSRRERFYRVYSLQEQNTAPSVKVCIERQGGWAMRTLEHANTFDCVLTAREHEISTLVSEGLSNKEIARRLHLTEGTVKTHVHKILQKARVPNRTALAARYSAIRQANGHAHEFVDAQPGQPGNAIKRARSVA
jgi:DNA-binding CsgD family transcriptional regulator